MSRATFPVLLIVILVAAFGAIALPELFGFMTGIENAETGVSSFVSELVGRLPVLVFVVIGLTFLAVLTTAGRR